RPAERRELPNVVRVVANDDKESLVELTTAERFAGGDGACGLMLEPGVAGRTALTLRVQTGCDERCSYCIIPSTRGAGASRPMPAGLRDAARRVAPGYGWMAVTVVH